ncbi:sickle tail protein-like [Arapaima gigas]
MIPQGTKSPDVKVQEATGNLESLPESLFKNQDQVAVLRSSRAYMKIAQETVLNPVLPCDEATPTPDNIAFKITDTEVQALSCGEYEEIMNTEGGNIQTINVSEAREMTSQEESSLGKKPVIIILDEPMDIRSAYKRLSTIFEGEEEPDQMLEENRIEEVPEENDLERNVLQDYLPKDERPKTTLGENTQNYNRPSKPIIQHHKATLDCSLVSAERAGYEKQDPKKKFKLKFPKKKLTALSQAIQTGTKTGKKTLQVVVYEDEEEADGTVKMAKETKRFEIGLHKSSSECTSTEVTGFQLDLSGFQRESDEFCNSASLEQTIKKSEACGTIIGSCPTIEPGAEDPKTSLTTLMEPIVKDAVMEGPISPNGSTSPPCKAIKAPKPRFPKPPPPPRPSVIPHSPTKSHQNTSFSSVASRSPSAVPRVLPDTTDKAKKQQKLPEHQSQFRQGHHTIVPPIQAEDHPFSTVVHKFLAASE